MIVDEIMTKEVVMVGLDDTLEQLQKLFEKHEFHHLLVVEDEELIGVISDRDVLKEISPYLNTAAEDSRARKSLKRKAHQIMSRKPVTVETNTTVENATSVLLKRDISCLPVISPSGDIEGILSWKDLLKFYVERTIEPLEISE